MFKRVSLMMALAVCTNILAAATPRTMMSRMEIGDYLGSQGLAWSTGGKAAWFGQTDVSRTGTAMQSGDIGDGQESWIETTVQGPCDLNFWWNVSSEESFDFLLFSVNGVEQDSLSGYNIDSPAQDIGWVQKKLSFSTGTHTLRWTYKKDVSDAMGLDCGWLANVEYVPYVTVTFDASGGVASTNEKVVQCFAPYGTLPTATKTGYLFSQWQTEEGVPVIDSTVVTIITNHTLYAQWTPNNYTVTFDAQGGDVTPTSTSVLYGAAYGDLPVPTRAGYLFDGWFTQSDSGGTEITASTIVSITDSQTLYTSWTPNTYSVVFDGQGGAVNPTNKMVSYKSAYGALPTSVLMDAVMESWWTEPNGKGQQISAETNVMITADQKLYAKWNINSILGTSNLPWTTDGSNGAFWLPQANVKPEGRTLAMQAGAITHNQNTWLETTVTGPGTFTFSWAISAELNRDMITCTTNGVIYKRLTSKFVNWTNETITVGEGGCTLRWTFAKDAAGNAASNTAWLSALTWTPQAGGFTRWARNLGLEGAPEVLFDQDRNDDGIPNGFEYAFGDNLSTTDMMLMIRSVNGRIVAEIPRQDEETIPFVTVTLKASSDLENWTLPTIPASDTTGMPKNREWREADKVPAQAFFKLQTEMK